MVKRLIALRGKGNIGKSTTFRILWKLIKETYEIELIWEEPKGVDVKVVFKIGELIIGIESQGDPNVRLEDTLNDFVRLKCDIIICATRTRGSTVNLVKALKPDYEVEFIDKLSEVNRQDLANQDMAETILTILKNVIKNWNI